MDLYTPEKLDCKLSLLLDEPPSEEAINLLTKISSHQNTWADLNTYVWSDLKNISWCEVKNTINLQLLLQNMKSSEPQTYEAINNAVNEIENYDAEQTSQIDKLKESIFSLLHLSTGNKEILSKNTFISLLTECGFDILKKVICSIVTKIICDKLGL